MISGVLLLMEVHLSSSDPVIPFPGRSGAMNAQSGRIAAKSSGSRIGSYYQHSQAKAVNTLPRKTIVLSTNAHLQKNTPDPLVSFQRKELNLILSCYGAMVSKGEWRDYAIDMGVSAAQFAIFRHSSEQPLYRIEKIPALAKKQGMYQLFGTDGRILKRGHELKALLKFFDKKLELVK